MSTEIIPSGFFVEESLRIVNEAAKQGLILRIMGALAIRHHTIDFSELHTNLGRVGKQEFTDIDFISYRKFANPLERFFTGIGYLPNRGAKLMGVVWASRHIYDAPKGFHVDVFFDKLLAANHPIDFRKRLELDSPTVSPTDLLLEKAQIVFPGEKDVKDMMLLLRAHEIAAREEENKINGKFIAQLLSSDWGFWYTLTNNLRQLKEHSTTIEALSADDRQDLASKANLLLKMIDEETEKSLTSGTVRYYDFRGRECLIEDALKAVFPTIVKTYKGDTLTRHYLKTKNS
jgi:hypothetical protein